MSLAEKIVAAVEARGGHLDRNPGEVNIVYVEGIDADGTANANRPNAFDDLRCVIQFENGAPVIAGSWEATTQSGERYTLNPVNDLGAAIIALGQQAAWQVGMHRGNHEALIQTGGKVTVYRDADKNYKREGDDTEADFFGINQHWGYDQPKNDIGPASAGCLVGRSENGHREFMAIVKNDPRFIAHDNFVFPTTVLTAEDILSTRPAAPISTRRFTGITATVFADNEVAYPDVAPGWNGRAGVALPFYFTGKRQQVRVTNPANGKSVVCEIIDQGPWNYTSARDGLPGDPYWQTGARPQAESGTDMTGRKTNFAGIDLTPVAAKAIGIDGKGLVDWEFVTTDSAIPPPAPPPITPEPIDVDPPSLAAIRRELADLRAMLENLMTNLPTLPDQNFRAMLDELDRRAAAREAARGGTQPAPQPAQPGIIDLLKPLMSKTNLGIGGLVATILGSLYTKTPLDSDFIITLLTLFGGLGGVGIGDKLRKANDATKQATAAIDKVLANLPKQ